MSRLHSRWPAAIAGVALSTSVAAAPPTPDQVHAGFVLYASSPVDGTVALARVVIEAGTDCPSLRFDGGSETAMTPRINPHPATFPIEVCEARYPFGQGAVVTGTDLRLPVASLNPVRLIVMGDSGCEGDAYQPCDTTASWPFPAFGPAAAGTGPDLVIHVGDYNYRGTPDKVTIDGVTKEVYDASGDGPLCRSADGYVSQNVPGSANFDNWDDWQRDFFTPAGPLLLAAPWVFVRGNHELCSRGGPGWFYLLDPASPLLGGGAAQQACPDQTGTTPELFSPPYTLDLDPLALAVVDSANACDAGVNFPEAYSRQLTRVQRQILDKPTWLLVHRPMWGMREAPDKEGPPEMEVINQTLQQALRDQPDGELPSEITLVLSGHMHRFQATSFGAARVPQLIIGNSGGRLSSDPPTGPFSATIDDLPATGISRDNFGFLQATLDPDGGWQGQVINPTLATDQVIATCAQPLSDGALCAFPDP